MLCSSSSNSNDLVARNSLSTTDDPARGPLCFLGLHVLSPDLPGKDI